MSSFDEFWDEFQAQFKRAPVWLPGTSMQLGDIGIIDGGGYLRVGSLADFGINFEEQPLYDTEPEYFFTSSSAKSKELQGSGAASEPTGIVGHAEASLHLHFDAARAFVVWAAHVQGTRIHDVLKVESAISRLHETKPFWNKKWIYIQEVVTAQPCVMVVAEASGTEATMKATGSGPGLGGFAQLFRAGAALELSVDGANVRQIVTPERAPLMWRGRWRHGLLKKKWDSKDRDEESGKEAIPPDMFEDFDDPEVFELE